MPAEGILAGVSISHDRATIDELEQASVTSQHAAVSELLTKDGVSEAFVLQTCNRVEGYVVAETANQGRDALAGIGSGVGDARREMGHEESLRHLLAVGAGLESLVLGEDQILGQVRDAYEDAREAGGIGSILESGVTKAIRVGERARTETAINEGVVSLASAAVRLAAERRGLVGATAAVLGTGEMGALAAKRLAPHVEQVILANRTESRAVSLADQLETDAVETVALSSAAEVLARADIVISATGSSEYIVETDAVAASGKTFIVDITRPRDIPPAADACEGITVYDLDRLESVTEKTRQMRREAATHVEAIVDEEFDRLLAQYKRQRADHVISAMYESAERVKADQLERTLSEVDLDSEERAAVESMADAIVAQLLAVPTESLRDAAEADDWSTIHTALTLFNPHFEPDEAPSPEFVAAMMNSQPVEEPAFEESDD